MFTIYECVYKPTGLVRDYLVHGNDEYAWIPSNVVTDAWEPNWNYLSDLRNVTLVFDDEDFNAIGEAETKAEALAYIKMINLIEV